MQGETARTARGDGADSARKRCGRRGGRDGQGGHCGRRRRITKSKRGRPLKYTDGDAGRVRPGKRAGGWPPASAKASKASTASIMARARAASRRSRSAVAEGPTPPQSCREAGSFFFSTARLQEPGAKGGRDCPAIGGGGGRRPRSAAAEDREAARRPPSGHGEGAAKRRAVDAFQHRTFLRT